MNILNKIFVKIKEKLNNDEENNIKKNEIIYNFNNNNNNNENNNNKEEELNSNNKNEELIKIEKNSFYKIKTKDELTIELEEFKLEDLFLDNKNLKEIIILYFKILDNNFDLFEEEFLKNENKNSISSIPKIKKYIELIYDNKKNIDKILKNKLSETNKKYIIKKNEGAYGKIYQNVFNKNIIIKNFDLEKIDLIDVYFEYFIQYIIYNFSDDIYKKNISQPYDLKLTTDLKSARIYMKKIEGITLHEYIYKYIIYNSNNQNEEIIYSNIKYIIDILIKICDLFIYLQSKFGFVHFDLHLGNIMIDKNQNIYLLDYGFSSINYFYNIKKDKILIVSKPKYLLFSKINEKNKLKFKYKSIDLLHLYFRLCSLLFKKIDKKNKIIYNLYKILNFITLFKELEHNDISEEFEFNTLFETLKDNIINNSNLCYKYSTNFYFLKKDIKNKILKNQYNNLNIIIDRFNPTNLKDILFYYKNNLNKFI